MKIAIFGNTFKKDTTTEVGRIIEYMLRNNVEVVLSQELRNEMNLREGFAPFPTSPTESADSIGAEDIDLAISVGGDGTVLTTVSEIGNRDIPVIGINLGRLGFLADVKINEVEQICSRLIEKDYQIEERTMLEVSTNQGWHIGTPYALNEVSVMKQELSSMISVEMMLNGEYVHTYRADGLVIATPTGSTAYNLSVGGPLVTPESKVLIVSPIATHSLNVRPLVIPDDWQIDLKVSSRSHSYLISNDGRSQTMREDVLLTIKKAQHTVKLVHLEDRSFFRSLRDKLAWGK